MAVAPVRWMGKRDMKRLMVGLFSALLVTVGLVGVSQVSANATCPYTGCVTTHTRVWVPNAPVKKGHKAKVCVKVTTDGNGAPKGRVTATVQRGSDGRMWSRTKQYPGHKVCFHTYPLKHKGTYSARGIYAPYSSSVFASSRDETTFEVK